jgi:hypothetical protein
MLSKVSPVMAENETPMRLEREAKRPLEARIVPWLQRLRNGSETSRFRCAYL